MKQLDADFAVEALVVGEVGVSHASRADAAEDLATSEGLANNVVWSDIGGGALDSLLTEALNGLLLKGCDIAEVNEDLGQLLLCLILLFKGMVKLIGGDKTPINGCFAEEAPHILSCHETPALLAGTVHLSVVILTHDAMRS